MCLMQNYRWNVRYKPIAFCIRKEVERQQTQLCAINLTHQQNIIFVWNETTHNLFIFKNNRISAKTSKKLYAAHIRSLVTTMSLKSQQLQRRHYTKKPANFWMIIKCIFNRNGTIRKNDWICCSFSYFWFVLRVKTITSAV